MLRSTLYTLRPLPPHASRVLVPRGVFAAPCSGRHEGSRGLAILRKPVTNGEDTSFNTGLIGLVFLAYVFSDYLPGSSRTNPKRLMRESLEFVKANDEVHNRLGSKLVGRGDQVHPRLFFTAVEHLELKDKHGRPCVRIRYNLFGPCGYASVFAEAAKDSKKGEFNFIFVQDLYTYDLIVVVDPGDIEIPWEIRYF